MSLSRADVVKTSLLARLRLSDSELDLLTTQLGQVVDFFRQLDEVDTSQIQPLAHALDIHNVFAEDELQDSLPRDSALANAPKHDDECYRVPAVLGD
jgi:aspartyl-tRNA(Asn)/glutamyl-tRNA(Gln) amidotransferase subunit C